MRVYKLIVYAHECAYTNQYRNLCVHDIHVVGAGAMETCSVFAIICKRLNGCHATPPATRRRPWPHQGVAPREGNALNMSPGVCETSHVSGRLSLHRRIARSHFAHTPTRTIHAVVGGRITQILVCIHTYVHVYDKFVYTHM